MIAQATSVDPNYSVINPGDVAVTNNDNDTAGFIIAPFIGLITTESGGQALFSVRLQSMPTANVTLPVRSSRLSEGTINVASLTFTPANWNTAQFVTITGVDDALRDGNQPYSVITDPATSSDSVYNGLNPLNPAVTNTDNDSPGVAVTPTSGLVTTESGGTATFTVVLMAQPTANVGFTFTSSDVNEGTALPANVTFTVVNWNVPQTITVTGIDDFVVDGNKPYTIVTNAITSADLGYNGLNPADVACTNNDND